MITMSSSVRTAPDVLFRELGGEAVLLNLKTGEYFGLDEVGLRMWTRLTGCGRVEAAYRELREEYDVAEDELRRDLLALAERLAAHGLVDVTDA